MKAVISRLTLVLSNCDCRFVISFVIVCRHQSFDIGLPEWHLQVGVPYSSVLVATGGNLPYTFLVLPANPNYNPPLTNLPAGLTLNSSTGALTGTPTTAGTYLVEFEVYDAQNKQRYAYCPITVTSACAALGDLPGGEHGRCGCSV